MATPNDPTPKKPASPGQTPSQRPAQPGAGKPAAQPGASRPAGAGPAKPGTPGAKPGAPAGKPGATPTKGPAAGKPAAKKPAAKKEKDSGGRRRIGQVMVDLGFLDEDQLWELLEEAKNTGQPTGQVALGRGLINEDQLLQALAEQANIKIVSLADVKPAPEALQLVPETMANVYKVLPLTYRDKVLTIAIGDPNNLAALDDLRNLLSISEVVAQLAPPARIAEALVKAYAGKEESIVDLIQAIESNPTLGPKRK